jgi:hypothetical protein
MMQSLRVVVARGELHAWPWPAGTTKAARRLLSTTSVTAAGRRGAEARGGAGMEAPWCSCHWLARSCCQRLLQTSSPSCCAQCPSPPWRASTSVSPSSSEACTNLEVEYLLISEATCPIQSWLNLTKTPALSCCLHVHSLAWMHCYSSVWVPRDAAWNCLHVHLSGLGAKWLALNLRC